MLTHAARRRLGFGPCLVALALLVPPGAAAQAPGRLILSLGSDGFVAAAALEGAAPATLIRDLGRWKVTDVSVIVLANIAYASLPPALQADLGEFLAAGGSLLLSGGAQSFGAGGYGDSPIAAALPVVIRAPKDFVSRPFRLAIPVTADHPILSGVRLPLVGNFNDMNPKGGATEIARYAGGGFFLSPLIAEQSGPGTVIAIAFDPNELLGGWPDGPAFIRNTIQYLLERSRLLPRTPPPK
jgi:hypothetical protein